MLIKRIIVQIVKNKMNLRNNVINYILQFD